MRLEPVAKTRKRRWRHRFENVDLCHEYFHDGAHTLEGVDRPEEIACGKISLYFVKLMQQLLKPKLVRLMDNDEQRLIVFRGWSAVSEATAASPSPDN
jgi:hypothetical protein